MVTKIVTEDGKTKFEKRIIVVDGLKHASHRNREIPFDQRNVRGSTEGLLKANHLFIWEDWELFDASAMFTPANPVCTGCI